MLNQRPCSLLISLNHTERTTGAPHPDANANDEADANGDDDANANDER